MTNLATSAPPPGILDLALSDAQVALVAPLLTDLDRTVVVGSIHPRPYQPGMSPELIGNIVARIGVVPRERITAIRQAARGEIKAKRTPKVKPHTIANSIPPIGEVESKTLSFVAGAQPCTHPADTL